jgi:D-alanyl-D-alanine carboxypeptidase
MYIPQAEIARLYVRCSPDAPQWIERATKYAIRHQGSMANQMVYITPEDQLHHCESGWTGGMFSSEPVKSNTRFRFASVTKVFTADAVLKLANDGKLSLDDPLIKYIPSERSAHREDVAAITVRHLLTHSAGFDRTTLLGDSMFHLASEPWCPTEPEMLYEQELVFSPGSKASYSNLGYCLLGLVVERASGVPFRDYMREHYQFGPERLAYVDGPYREDEVEYDLRFENFYMRNYYEKFDFQALSSAAGLSGNAVVLAEEVQRMLRREPLNLLSGNEGQDCDASEFRKCYGFALYQYRELNSSLDVYIQGGNLPGNTNMVMVDDHGGVTAWVSSGQPLRGFAQTKELYSYLYSALEEQYSVASVQRE